MNRTKDDIIDLYHRGCAMMIFSFNANVIEIKDVILRNFLAKSISQLITIKTLKNFGQILDSYIIYRSMVDRLGHLYFLQRTNSFRDFEDWSFCKQMDANNNSLSDINFKDGLDKSYFMPTQENKDRYRQIKKRDIKWKRPDIEEEFKIKDLYFLYKFGYDYASTHVHPMSNDGMIEYFRMIKNPPEDIIKYFDHQTQLIVRNSALISSLTVNECLNFSSLKWRRPVFEFIGSFRQAINDEESNLEFDYFKMKKFIDENLPLGQKD